jgi:hypothetical protein
LVERIVSLSTSVKPRPVSQEHSRASVDDYVKMDVQEYLSQGVGLDDFIKTVLDFDKNSYEELKTRANTWLTTPQGQNTFAELSKVYNNKLKRGLREQAVCAPLSNMAGFIQTNAMTASNTPAERHIKLALTYDKTLDGKKSCFCNFPKRFEVSPIASANAHATTSDAPTIGVSSEDASDDGDEEDEDENWKFVVTPLEVGLFRSYGLRKPCRRNVADQTDASFSKDVSSSYPHDEPLVLDDNVLSEQTQTATSPHDDGLVQSVNLPIKVLSCRGDRSFALVPVVTEQYISVSYYSREGFIESEVVDLLKTPVMPTVVLGLFVKFSSDLPRLGFNKKMGYFDSFDPDNTTSLHSNMQFTAITKADGGDNQDNQPGLNQLQLGEHITRQVGDIGRGTSIYRLENTRFNVKRAAKHSYQVVGHPFEQDIIPTARRVDPVHVLEIIGYAIEGSDQILKTLRDACPIKPAKYEEREFRVLVMRKYTTISELGVDEEFLHAMAQIMTCKSRTLFQWRCCTNVKFRHTRFEQEGYPSSRYIHT